MTPLSKYEDQIDVTMMHALADRLERAAAELEVPIPARPLLGTLPTGRLDAMTLPVPCTDTHIVLVETRLFQFAHLTAQAVAEVFPFTQNEDDWATFSLDEDRLRESLSQNPLTVHRFAEIVEAYLLTGTPGTAPPYLQVQPQATLAAVMRDGLELFVLGREYGHAIDGHVGTQASSGLPVRVEGLSYTWEEEIYADLQGTELVVAAQQEAGLDLSLSYAGVDFCFSVMETLDRALSVLRYGEEGRTTYTSHPPPGERRDLLREVLLRSGPPEQMEPMIQLGVEVQTIVELLWDHARPALAKTHASGARPLPTWRG